MKLDLDRLMAERLWMPLSSWAARSTARRSIISPAAPNSKAPPSCCGPAGGLCWCTARWSWTKRRVTGMETALSTRWDLVEIIREKNGDLLAAKAEQMRRILADYGVRGRVGFYGHGEIGQAHALLSALEKDLPDTQVVVEFDG